MGKLPIYSNEKQIGNIAADTLKSVLQKFAVVNIHDESIDLGIDMRAQIVEKKIPKKLFFNIQSKGKEDVDATDLKNNCFKVQIKIATVNYWFQQNETTFLFIVDNETGNCYWCNPILQLMPRITEIQKNNTVIIDIPLNNCLNSNSKSLPKEFINCIILYSVHNISKISDVTNKINNIVYGNDVLDTELSFQILSILMKEIDKIENDYNEIAETLIQNIKLGLSDSIKYFIEVDQIYLSRHYCPEGVFLSKAFSRSNKSIKQLQEEANGLITDFQNHPRNVEILKSLESIYREIEEIMCNAIGFLYEMVCEDDPFNDHSELDNKRDEIINKHYHRDLKSQTNL